MRKMLFILILTCILLTSCEYIPQYKFTTDIPDSLLEARYGLFYENSLTDLYIDLNLDSNGAFSCLAAGDKYTGLIPSKGVYSVSYSSYHVISASGEIRFTDTEGSSGTVAAAFVWTASAENGTESLQLTFSNGTNIILEWLGDANV